MESRCDPVTRSPSTSFRGLLSVLVVKNSEGDIHEALANQEVGIEVDLSTSFILA